MFRKKMYIPTEMTQSYIKKVHLFKLKYNKDVRPSKKNKKIINKNYVNTN